jgi:hypothetical protein
MTFYEYYGFRDQFDVRGFFEDDNEQLFERKVQQ